MADTSQVDYVLGQGWAAISWTRTFDEWVAVIMVKPNGAAMFRLQHRVITEKKHFGNVDSLREAHEEVTRLVALNPILYSGA